MNFMSSLFKCLKHNNGAVLTRCNLHLQSNKLTPPLGVPLVIEQSGRGERTYDIYSRLLKERIVCLMAPVDDFVSGLIVAQLLFLQAESKQKPVHMYINSPGGSVTAGLAIYDTMQLIQCPVATWCVGQAASMGSLLLCAGTPGMRTALPNSSIMVHQPLGGAQGQASDIILRAAEMQKVKHRLNNLYVQHTGRNYQEIEKALDRDNFMSALEAKKFGLIDQVIESKKTSNLDLDSITASTATGLNLDDTTKPLV